MDGTCTCFACQARILAVLPENTDVPKGLWKSLFRFSSGSSQEMFCPKSGSPQECLLCHRGRKATIVGRLSISIPVGETKIRISWTTYRHEMVFSGPISLKVWKETIHRGPTMRTTKDYVDGTVLRREKEGTNDRRTGNLFDVSNNSVKWIK